MFQKSKSQQSKDRILKQFKTHSSTIRCIVATVALGMGLDIRDIDLVIHVGCLKSVLSYLQEAGRCARDGRFGFSLILYDMFTLALKTTGKDMADIVRNADKKCIRKEIISLLSVGEPENLTTEPCEKCCENIPCKCSSCTCCSTCAKKCPCYEKNKYCVEYFLSDNSRCSSL